ncbi:hypothetical protein TYRP_010897 [Tyrophagus putrescentiae]|nr:hypothetical protein TYRP_010897 [Tyrophagus putrescentiae]
MNLLCFTKLRERDCFCSRYDENRQTMFYCGFFTALAGFIWFLVGFALRCAFFTQAFGPSVIAIACASMVVGILVLILGLVFTMSVVLSGKSYNKTGCVSSALRNQQRSSSHTHRKENIFFDSPLQFPSSHKGSSPLRSDSFSSAELNPSSSSSSSTEMSPSSTSHSATSYKSNIAIIA